MILFHFILEKSSAFKETIISLFISEWTGIIHNILVIVDRYTLYKSFLLLLYYHFLGKKFLWIKLWGSFCILYKEHMFFPINFVIFCPQQYMRVAVRHTFAAVHLLEFIIQITTRETQFIPYWWLVRFSILPSV